jgi:hypothetical protein
LQLTKKESSTLEAAIDRIFPEAGSRGNATKYILAQVLSKGTRDVTRMYKEGLAELNRVSNTRFGNNFGFLIPQQQDEVLRSLQTGNYRIGKCKASEFFSLLRNHIIQGTFSHPKYGGNKNYFGWKLIEFDGYRQERGYSKIERRVG